MAADFVAEIDKLKSYFKACSLMEELGLNTDDVRTLEEAKKKLRIFAGRRKGGRVSQPSKKLISKIRETDQKLREEVIFLYGQVRNFLGQKDLPDFIMADIKKAFPDLEKELDVGEDSLKHEKCAILVAGETSAGKSTLLNLLLGQTNDNLLPTHTLSTTSVICELKYSDSPYALAHPWPDDKEARIIQIPLTERNAKETLSKYVYETEDRGRKFPFQKVEIFWPCEWLKAGVTIVDSPGIGESEMMTSLVMEYMPKCFGFIYVLASNNAGGIQHDRLQDMLLTYRKASSKHNQADEEEGWQLDPRSAVFVANKWDTVPTEDRDRTKNDIHTKLRSIWGGLDESQVFFLSAKEAMGSMEGGVVNEDYDRLLWGLESLLPVGLKQKVTKHFSSLSFKMRTATRIIKTYVTQLKINDIEREYICEEVSRRLSEIEKRPQEIKKSLEKMMDSEVRSVVIEAQKHFEKAVVIRDLCDWKDSDCPNSDSLDLLDDLLFAYALKRIRNELNTWDKDNRVFEGIQERVLKFLKENFLSLEEELDQIERDMATGEKEQPTASAVPMVSVGDEDIAFSKKEKLILGLTAPVWVPLALIAGLFALPVYGIKQALKRRAERRKLDEYRANKGGAMAKCTKILLDLTIMNGDMLQRLLAEKIEETTSLIKKIYSRIPNMIETDKQIVDKLRKKSYADEKLLTVLYSLQDEALLLQGDVDLMYMTSIRSYDMTVDDLEDWKETDRPIAQGHFAKVFKATVNMPGKKRLKCAVKMLKDSETKQLIPLSNKTASDAWQEESSLRKLQHEHVVKYYGTALKSTGPLHYLIMIMEFCTCSLETYIEDRDLYTPPSACPDNNGKWLSSLTNATDLAWQIVNGIAGVHSLGFVHRDLKPANILMTESHHIRLADLGLAKSEKKITGTVAGTPLFMAPEIFSEGRYGRSADMFSYGMILWEMWYGSYVSDIYKVQNLSALPKVAFKKSRRPEEDGPWSRIMVECWSEEQKNRPSANTCCTMLAEYKKKLSLG